MYTTVVKFNALADPVGAAAKDDDFFSCRFYSFIFLLIG